jgi:hypothetical protein
VKRNRKKSRYNDLFLKTTALTPPKQHPKFNFSKSDASKKGTEHKHHRRPIKDLRFSPLRKSLLSKQCLQQGHCQAQPIKARSWIFTLKDKTMNFSYAVAPTIMPLLQVTNQ